VRLNKKQLTYLLTNLFRKLWNFWNS